MVDIIAGSASLYVLQRPEVDPPVVELGRPVPEGPSAPAAFFRTRKSIQIKGGVSFGAEEGDSTDGWTVGLIQAGYCVEDWAYYRGQRDADGSVLVRRDVPPALPQRACRDCGDDTPVSNIFCDFAGQKRLERLERLESLESLLSLEGPSLASLESPSRRLDVDLTDGPRNFCWTTMENRLTWKLNYLTEAAIETQFCTVLSVQDPKRAFHHQKHVYWSVRWHATFHPWTFDDGAADFRVELAQTRGDEAWVSEVLDGEPTRATPLGAKFADVLTSPQHQSCNQMHRAARDVVNRSIEGANRRNSASWQMLRPYGHGSRGSPAHVPLGG